MQPLNADKATEMTSAAEAFANQLIALESEITELKGMHLQATAAAEQAKTAVAQNSAQLQKKLAEKQRLLAEKAALDAQIAENANKQTKKRGQTGKPSGDGDGKPEKSKGGVVVKKNVDDPLDGL